MNEEQLIEFVNWLPSVVPEFKDATPDQIVQALNQMSESDEGQQMLSQLINTFQQAKQSANSQMFKKGGKLAAFVSKYGKGGEMCCKKKAILQGGMVNKVAEKMQDGGEIVTTVSASSLGYNPYGIMDKIGTSEGLQQPAGRKAIKSTILDNAQQNGQILSKKDLRQQTKAANFVNRAQEGLIGEGRLNKKLPQMMNIINSIPVAQEGGDTTDWFQSMILDEIPNMNFIQRRQLGPNSYVHELSATREGLASPTLGKMIETNPNTGQSDTTYVRFFMDPFTEPIFTNITGNAKKQADSKIEGLRDKANSKGAKIRK